MKTKELTKLKPRNLLKFFESLYNFKNSKFIVFNDLTDNWGDALNKYLVKEIFDKTPYSTLSTFKPPQKKSYAVIGSILSFHNLNDIEIWGAGLISDNVAVKGKPSKVHALRGPLTAKILRSNNIQSPNVFGDPAILLPLYYKPKYIKKYKLGMILHKTDRGSECFENILKEEGVLNIDIYSDTTKFIDQVNSCEVIASSSLHGLIAADSYNVPRTWLNGGAIERHDRFKFDDYFLGMGFTDNISPYNGPLKLRSIIESSQKYSHKPQIISALLDACPFKGI